MTSSFDESTCAEACVQVHVADRNNMMTSSLWWVHPDKVDDISALITEHLGTMPECVILDGNEVMEESQTIWNKSIQLGTE